MFQKRPACESFLHAQHCSHCRTSVGWVRNGQSFNIGALVIRIGFRPLQYRTSEHGPCIPSPRRSLRGPTLHTPRRPVTDRKGSLQEGVNHIYIYMYAHTHTSSVVHAHILHDISVCVYIYIYISIYLSNDLHTYIRIHYIHTHIYIHIYICIYT